MKMPEEPEQETNPPPVQLPCAASDALMDLDFDLDGSWTLDQIFAAAAAASGPGSPFPISNSEQPCSPLWVFPDDSNDVGFVSSGGFRLSHCSKFPVPSCSPDSVTETALVKDDKKTQISPFIGFMPIDSPDGSCIIKERMVQALRHFKDLTEQHVLAQVWAPVKNGNQYVLTTSGQPFFLDPNSNGLRQYRLVSLMYMFSVDGDTDGVLGLPGRVFQKKLPEWTPNVQYYSSKEFPRLNHALHYNVRGTLALPVFEPSGHSCVGVLELVMSSQKINYAAEVDRVCKALEAVNLKSSEILDHQSPQICNEGRQNALAEILEILTVVCETHMLPLAQTWVPCRHRSVLANGGGFKKTCSSFDGSCMGQVCMSTTDVAFYIVDAHLWSFREACAEHHLQKWQGVAGRAFASQNSCFCEDITMFCKTEYPLVHYARMFGLRSSFAICLRSTHTGGDDYVLEFFLPPNVQEYGDQQAFLDSLLVTMKQHFPSLRVASGKDLDDSWRSIEIIKPSTDEKVSPWPGFSETSPPISAAIPNGEMARQDCLKGSLATNVQENTRGDNKVQIAASTAEGKDKGKKPEKKRGRAEKAISLEVLQQYFAGSLKDAVKSLGVSRSRLKDSIHEPSMHSQTPCQRIKTVHNSIFEKGAAPNQEESFITVKADFKGDFIKFQLSASSGMMKLKDEVKKRMKLSTGTFKIEYLTADKTRVPLNTDGELHEYMTTMRSLGINTMKLVIEPTVPQNEAMENEVTLTVNARHKDDLIKFDLPPSGIVGLKNEIMKRFKLEAGSFEIKYDQILDDDAPLQNCIGSMNSSQRTIMRLSIEPVRAQETTDRECLLIVKASYKGDIVKFQLSLSSGMVELKNALMKRLKLEDGSFVIKYWDKDHNEIVLDKDALLNSHMNAIKSMGMNTMKVFLA